MAISLGRSSGATLLGRPLEVNIRATLDRPDAGNDACLSAEVFYADDRIDKSRVRSSIEKVGPGQDALIRIRVSKVVDEPVVTLYVRAGCEQRTERRYVLLADVAPEQDVAVQSSTAVSPAAGAALSFPAAGAVPVRPGAGKPVPAGAGVRHSGRLSALPRLEGAPRADSRPVPKPRARLQLEPLDLSIETSPQLKSSGELLSQPSADAEQRQAAAALWKALTAQPQDILRDAEKIDAIEADMRRLRVETQKNQAALAEFRVELHKARDERYANGLVYGLTTALALALAGLAYFWRRHRPGTRAAEAEQPWWRRRKPAESSWHGSELGVIASDYGGHAANDIPPPAASPDRPSRADTGAPASAQTRGRGKTVSSRFAPPLSRRDHSDFALSMPHTPRAAKAEELFDVQHQSEFFISLGQYEQAIAVLRDHIGDDVQTSALIYLDLFNLYHKLKRKDEYRELRAEFNRMFNAQVPLFDAYTELSSGLESYPSTLSRIESSWASARGLEVIEALILRSPDAQEEAFQLDAYRELLLLYGVARGIAETHAPGAASLLDFDLAESVPAAAPAGTGDHEALASDPLQFPPLQLQHPALAQAAGAARSLASPDSVPRLDIDLNALVAENTVPPAPAVSLVTLDTPENTPALPPLDGNLIDFEALSPAPVPAVDRAEKKSPRALTGA